MAEGIQPVTPSLLDQFRSMTMQQKIGLMFATAAVIAVLVGAWMWEQTPDYKVLYTNLSDRDGGAIITSLQQMNVPYKFTEGGGALLVPENQVHEVRLRLASQGLPKGGVVGFELMENQKFGTSQFQEQVNYQRGLEGELARTIGSIASVQGARIHLAIPKPSVFVREQEKPSASVLLDLYPGKVIDPGQVNAIIHLVSSSVAELSPKNVTVVDQMGNLLSQTSDSIAINGMNPGQLKYLQDIEKSYIKHIEDILSPILGPGNVRAQVTADIDFSQVENTSETYRPNQTPANASVRSTQTMETQSNSPQSAIGIPGALSNQPPGPATAPISPTSAPLAASAAAAQNTHKEATTNYEVDKTISHTKNPVGTVKRLSVAVVVNYRKSVDATGKASYKALSPQEIKEMGDLAKEAVGYDAQRGDTVNVVNSAFSVGTEEVAKLPWYKQPEVIEMIKTVGKNLLIVAIILYLIFGIIKPTFNNLKAHMAARAAEAAEKHAASSAAAEHHAANITVSHEHTVQAAKDLAKENPQVVASVIKGWVAGNE